MKILFYSLHAAIWVHALPENRLVRELVEAGHEVVYVSCGKTFLKHCTSMSANGLELSAPQDIKSLICQACEKNAETLVGGNGARHYKLNDMLSPGDEAAVEAGMLDAAKGKLIDFRYEGIEIGRVASYELFLKYKKMSEELAPEEQEFCSAYIENSLRSLIGFRRIFDIERPDIVFFYSPQYAVNGVCAQFAASRGRTVYFIEGSSSNSERYDALRVWDWSEHGLVNPALQHWTTKRNALSITDVRRVFGHFRELFGGTSFAVYSAPVAKRLSIKERFRVPPQAKVILATLSSYDEAYAAYLIGKFPERKVTSVVFKDQFEWIKSTIGFVDGRDDIFLIVRVHPRDFPNKRENLRSEQASRWERDLGNLPKNVAVNWPSDEISLYNLLDQVDAVVTGWSATGVEALIFGVPVVTYDRALPSYPDDVHLSGESEEEYFRNIQRALDIDRRGAVKAGAYRWLAVNFSLGTIRVRRPLSFDTVWPRMITSKLLIRLARRFMTDDVLRRIDARRKLSNKHDATLFLRLVSLRAKDLYEVRQREQSGRAEAMVIEATIRSQLRRVDREHCRVRG